MAERRKHFRYLARVDVKIELRADGPELFTTFVPIGDISQSGMFIITRGPLPLGSELFVCLSLDGPLRLRCAVRQCVPGRGMGVEFLDLTLSSRQRLEAFLVTVAEPSLVPAR
jgi:hypothetical protein